MFFALHFEFLLLTAIFVEALFSISIKGSGNHFKAHCDYFNDKKGLRAASCIKNYLITVPDNIMNNVESLNLNQNYIRKLSNTSFNMYPNIKKLYMELNGMRTVEPGALLALGDLEVLNLSRNPIKEVPAGLPKSLQKLYLNGDPVKDMTNLRLVVGLQELHMRNCQLSEYPQMGLLPNLVELDVSENARIVSLEPQQLASTCRLARLNVTNTGLFRTGSAGDHCRCLRVLEWFRTYNIKVYGLDSCPEPLEGDGDKTATINCTQLPDAALTLYKECKSEKEHWSMLYWVICLGVAIFVAVTLVLFVCWCRRRRTDKVQRVPSAETNNESSDDKEMENSLKDGSFFRFLD